MLVIPAIDLRQRQVVRLLQGRAEDMTVYSDDPVAVARQFEAQGPSGSMLWTSTVPLPVSLGTCR